MLKHSINMHFTTTLYAWFSFSPQIIYSSHWL